MIRRALLPPVFTDEEQTRVARLLHWTLIVLAGLNIIDVALLAVFAPETIPTFWMNEVFLFFIAAAFALMRWGRVRAGGYVICLSFWGLLVLDLATTGGIASPAFALLYLVTIFATVVLGTSGTAIFGGLSIATTLTLYLAENNGLLAPTQPPTTMRLFPTYTAALLGVTIMLAFSGHSVQTALNRARKGERDLAKRNQQLSDEISRREQAQREQSRLAAILETTSDFVGMVDVQGQSLYLNSAGRKLMGIGEYEDISGMQVADYHPAKVAEMILNVAIPMAVQRGIWSGETILLTRSGREIPISQVLMAHRGVNDTVEYLSTVIRDLSEHQEAEQNRLELALQRERVELFKEFIGNISHDLRTPLTIINTSLYLLERAEDPQRRRDKMDSIREQAGRLERLIQDLLTISRLDQAPQLTLTPLGLNRLLTEVKNHIVPTAENKHLTLHFELDGAIPPILADEQELYRALVNLVENAVNYTPEGGSVIVATDLEDNKVVTRVRDTGIGIPPEALPHIFERFYRADGARKVRAEGTGLGLAIVKRIVEMHHGTINVESQSGVGTTFCIALPIPISLESVHVN